LRQIEEFRSELANGATVGTQDGGESTENEEEGRGSAEGGDEEEERNISVEVNDL
jgi:hypothetical protein